MLPGMVIIVIGGDLPYTKKIKQWFATSCLHIHTIQYIQLSLKTQKTLCLNSFAWTVVLDVKGESIYVYQAMHKHLCYK